MLHNLSTWCVQLSASQQASISWAKLRSKAKCTHQRYCRCCHCCRFWPHAAGAPAGSHGTGVTFTSSELDDLMEDIVSDKPALNLCELEAKLDIISPDDLTVRHSTAQGDQA
jgi:hypothetical protein